MRRMIIALLGFAIVSGSSGIASGEETGAILPVDQFTRYDEFVSPKL